MLHVTWRMVPSVHRTCTSRPDSTACSMQFCIRSWAEKMIRCAKPRCTRAAGTCRRGSSLGNGVVTLLGTAVWHRMTMMEWLPLAALLLLYALCFATIGARTFANGHTWLGVCGAVVPIFWVLGIALPARQRAGRQTADQRTAAVYRGPDSRRPVRHRQAVPVERPRIRRPFRRPPADQRHDRLDDRTPASVRISDEPDP